MKKLYRLNFMHSDTGPGQQKDFLPYQEGDYRLLERLDEWLAGKLLQAIGCPPVSIKLWNNREIGVGTASPVARIKIKDRPALLTLLANPAFYFGELYSAGDVDIEGNLPEFLDIIYRYLPVSNRYSWLSAVIRKMRPNSLEDARRNIHHHYDIGNEFYEAWLDRASMQYTCAYFSDPTMSLEEAQLAKMHHICRKLSLQPGQRVVEAGCGWGGLARFMAREYGVNVRAYNISHEQIKYARQKAQEERLTDKVEFIEDDFRNIKGDFDVFVSVGMLEHIGIDNYRVLGEVIDRVLKEDGIGLVHAIGRNQPDDLNEWIETRIFPGACPPSISQMMDVFEPYAFSVLDIENLRLHYAMTIKHWLERYEQNMHMFRPKYDEAFLRGWRLYLAGSEAAFTAGTMQLFQVLFTRQQNNKLPWSRSYIYSDRSN
jgi:cyclopropane-fatty-acyl-phospholipid synthase